MLEKLLDNNLAKAIALLLLVSSFMGMVRGIIEMSYFFSEYLYHYDLIIRAPLLFVLNIIWPFGSIPEWFADLFVIHTIFIYSLNILIKREIGVSLRRFISFLNIFNEGLLPENTPKISMKRTYFYMTVVYLVPFYLPIYFLVGYISTKYRKEIPIIDHYLKLICKRYFKVIIEISLLITIVLATNYQLTKM